MRIHSKNEGGSITIKLSHKSTLYVRYHVDSDEGVWYDNDGAGSPPYSEIIIDEIYYNDEDITQLSADFEPLEDFIISKIQDEY